MLKLLLAILLMVSSATACSTNTPPDLADNKDQTITIWMVRHGKTILNNLDRVQGWADSPLTQEGKRTAEYLGAGLKDIRFDAFYSSDAGRQRETMKIIQRQIGMETAPLTELTGLREVYFGSFEGGFNRDMAAAGARQLGLNGADALFSRMKAGTLPIKDNINAIASADPSGMTESYLQVKTRVQAALHTIINNALRQHQKNILVISSGTALQIMISDLTDNPQKNKPLANSAVVKLVYHKGNISVTEIGNMSYIEQGKKALMPSN